MFRFGPTASWVELSQNQTGLDLGRGLYSRFEANELHLRLLLKENRWATVRSPLPSVPRPIERGAVSFIGEMGHADFTTTTY